ncbi:MAG: bifunctional methylenetetrahydrofolate dehydrogenase/methenyltetrahydrofolate cyclohydrolase FolD [Beijerinckiaceae bacterium]
MSATIIDGKSIADRLCERIGVLVAQWQRSHGATPGLAVVLVGEDPASRVYVANKARRTREAGMHSREIRLDTATTQADLLRVIAELNADDAIDGILVQLPLPKQIDANAVIAAIDPAKDVDGFHPVNVGRVATGTGGIVPCTPLGSMILLRSVEKNLAGKHAVVVGRSNIVGKPMAQLLLGADCTVTVAHSRTHDLPALCRTADILVAAVGRPEMLRGNCIKPGAIIIDVGINRVPLDDGSGKSRLVGDVHFNEAAEMASAITPVPGGVGPMTIACLLYNTLEAAAKRRGLPFDAPSIQG